MHKKQLICNTPLVYMPLVLVDLLKMPIGRTYVETSKINKLKKKNQTKNHTPTAASNHQNSPKQPKCQVTTESNLILQNW